MVIKMMQIKKRIGAFLLDMLLILFLSVAVSNLSYLNPYKYNYNEAYEEYSTVYQEYISSITSSSSSITTEYTNEYLIDNIIPVLMKVNKYNSFLYIWYLVFYFLYFIIFAYFNNGQTLGKKLFNLKVVNKENNKLSFIRLFIRSLFNGSNMYLGVNICIILKLLLVFISNPTTYYYLNMVISLISYGIEIALFIILMMKSGNTSLNDIIARTKVVEVK